VAHNNLIGELRRKAGRRRILEQALVDVVESVDQPEPLGFAGEVRDDLLRMLSFAAMTPFLGSLSWSSH